MGVNVRSLPFGLEGDIIPLEKSEKKSSKAGDVCETKRDAHNREGALQFKRKELGKEMTSKSVSAEPTFEDDLNKPFCHPSQRDH